MPAVATATPAPSPAVPAASEERTPRFLDTYGLLYGFTLLWLVPAIVVLASLPMYSYSNAYAALVALPPVLGMVSLLLTDPVRPPWRTLAWRAPLLVVLAVGGSVTVMFVALLFLPLVTGSITTRFNLFGIVSIVALIVVSSPMLIVLVRMVRERQWLRAVVLVLAVAAVAFVVYLSVIPTKTLATALRKDQISFLIGGFTWYLPAYGIAGAVCRSLGLG